MLTVPWLALALFMALVLAVSLCGLAASGHFPPEHRAPSLRSPMGGVILFGSLAACVMSLAVGFAFAWRTLPWATSIIGAGLMLLATPLGLRPLPDWFVNGRSALLLFAAIAVASAVVMLYWS